MSTSYIDAPAIEAALKAKGYTCWYEGFLHVFHVNLIGGYVLVAGFADGTLGCNIEDAKGELVLTELYETSTITGTAPASEIECWIAGQAHNMERRIIADALKRADERFWASVAESFPHIKTGDMDPWTDHIFATAQEVALRVWLEMNASAAAESKE